MPSVAFLDTKQSTLTIPFQRILFLPFVTMRRALATINIMRFDILANVILSTGATIEETESSLT